MIKAVFKDGVFEPLEPLPDSLSEGDRVELRVVAGPQAAPDAIDEFERLRSGIPESDHDIMERCLEEQRAESKQKMAAEAAMESRDG